MGRPKNPVIVNWFQHILGLDNAAGAWYLFWSGSGANFTRFTLLLTGPVVLWRRYNCEVAGCHRLGRHKTAAEHMVCRKHHPEDHLTAEQVAEHHWRVRHGRADEASGDAPRQGGGPVP